MTDYGPPPTALSPDRPGNDPTTRAPGTNAPVTSRPAEQGTVPNPYRVPSDPYSNVVTDANGNVVAPVRAGGTGAESLGLGVYVLGAIAVVSLADTRVAPVVTAFLVAAVVSIELSNFGKGRSVLNAVISRK